MIRPNTLLAALLPVLLAAGGPAAAQAAFDLEDTVAQCASCHGEDGVPIDPAYPVIWGQEFFYVYTQLKDYAAGRRENEIMTPMAAQFDRDQMKEIAQHFADKAWPAIDNPPDEDGDQKIAERAISQGQCSACHSTFEGDSRIPRLAGQQTAYLEQTMLDFKNEVRMNAPDKISTMKQLDDETISALARYLGAL